MQQELQINDRVRAIRLIPDMTNQQGVGIPTGSKGIVTAFIMNTVYIQFEKLNASAAIQIELIDFFLERDADE